MTGLGLCRETSSSLRFPPVAGTSMHHVDIAPALHVRMPLYVPSSWEEYCAVRQMLQHQRFAQCALILHAMSQNRRTCVVPSIPGAEKMMVQFALGSH